MGNSRSQEAYETTAPQRLWFRLSLPAGSTSSHRSTPAYAVCCAHSQCERSGSRQVDIRVPFLPKPLPKRPISRGIRTPVTRSRRDSPRTRPKPLNLGGDALHGLPQVAHHQLGGQPKHVIRSASQQTIATSIGPPRLLVILTIPLTTSRISGASKSTMNLPSTGTCLRKATPPAAKRFEQAGLRRRRRVSHFGGALSEHALSSGAGTWSERRTTHRHLLGPRGERPGSSPQAQDP